MTIKEAAEQFIKSHREFNSPIINIQGFHDGVNGFASYLEEQGYSLVRDDCKTGDCTCGEEPPVPKVPEKLKGIIYEDFGDKGGRISGYNTPLDIQNKINEIIDYLERGK